MTGVEVLASILAVSSTGFATTAIVYVVKWALLRVENKDLEVSNALTRDALEAMKKDRDREKEDAQSLRVQVQALREQLDDALPDAAIRAELRGGVPDVPPVDGGGGDELRGATAGATELP